MNRFFTTDEVYKDRLDICRSCIYYFKPTGQCKRCLCFMKVKARLAPMACPEKYWNKTTTIETPEGLPEEIVEEVKKRMIELYNTIHQTNYSTGTNCSSCLSSCLNGIKDIYNLYKS